MKKPHISYVYLDYFGYNTKCSVFILVKVEIHLKQIIQVISLLLIFLWQFCNETYTQ